ncbi:MAG: hypothetical protein OXE87_10855 [Chloroflexi bacterium]|nr:hypothetical protein [Chloroflexota bacterium]
MNTEKQREMETLADIVDRELDADRIYFQRRPKRRHRVRRVFPNERRAFELMTPDTMPGPSVPLYVAVQQLEPGLRLRLPFTNLAGSDLTDADLRRIGERKAASIFQAAQENDWAPSLNGES